MNCLPPNRWSAEDFTDLEQLVAGAKEYVVPSAGLRSRVIESAVSIDQMQLHWVKLRSLFLLAVAAWLLVWILYWITSAIFSSPTQSELSPSRQSPSEYSSQRSYANE